MSSAKWLEHSVLIWRKCHELAKIEHRVNEVIKRKLVLWVKNNLALKSPLIFVNFVITQLVEKLVSEERIMRMKRVSSLLIGSIALMICFVHGIPQIERDLDIGEGICFWGNWELFLINFADDSCTLNDGSVGTCKIDKDCPYVIDLLKVNKRHEIVKCGFRGRNQIVCCKESTATQFGAANQFSSRFSKLLCEGPVAKKPNKPIKWVCFFESY